LPNNQTEAFSQGETFPLTFFYWFALALRPEIGLHDRASLKYPQKMWNNLKKDDGNGNGWGAKLKAKLTRSREKVGLTCYNFAQDSFHLSDKVLQWDSLGKL